QLEELKAKIEKVAADLAREKDALATMTSAAEIRDAESRIEATERVLTMYQSTYATLYQSVSSAQAPNVLSIVEYAYESGTPIPQRKPLKLAMAGLAGLALCFGAVLFMEYLDDRLAWDGQGHGPVLGLQVLGAIPQMSRRHDSLEILENPDSRAADEIRALRARVQLLLT
ncbi:MAG: hypothetical protein H5T69_21630, partial [Chloroflexi bacterium]|nr:hypothetical protein [Chloroflexota bacterium]